MMDAKQYKVACRKAEERNDPMPLPATMNELERYAVRCRCVSAGDERFGADTCVVKQQEFEAAVRGRGGQGG